MHATQPLSEADTRAKLIDPALHRRGWTEDFIRREQTACGIDIVDGKPRRRKSGRTDYLLCLRIASHSTLFPVAFLEAKKNSDPPEKGLEQAKRYALLNHAPFVYSSNGFLFIEHDFLSGKTSAPKPMEEFPLPSALKERYEKGNNFNLENEQAKPLLMPYQGGEASRRYYQDAAIRAVLEKIAAGEKRVLLSLATGSGKTHIAAHLLKKIADAGQLRRALFLCDRDELRTQAGQALQNMFGTNAAPVSSANPQKNARILIATYQTLNVSGEDEDAGFLIENYTENYFSHIIIDECHRSAWGKWSLVLKRNPDAVQIGLTATPRYWKQEYLTDKEEPVVDDEITANNLQYFGEPVYEYPMEQGMEDGYLPRCEIIRRITDLDEKGITREDLEKLSLKDARTGQKLTSEEARGFYTAPSYEDLIQLPDRVRAWCKDLFDLLLQTGGPHQKTVIFCVRDTHADHVVSELNNLYTDWCANNEQKRAEPYAFKCTASVGGSDTIADLRGLQNSHFIAATVDLITTGVDVPILRNVVFFKFVRSPIAFHQMLGRGSRVHLPTNKLMFRVYDFTNATRLLGKSFDVRPAPTREREDTGGGGEGEKIIRAEGLEVRVNPAGTYIVTQKDGKLAMLTVEEYKERLAARLLQEVKTVDALREHWLNPPERKTLLSSLPDAADAVKMLQDIEQKKECDPYDILAELGFGIVPKTRKERAESLQYKHEDWLKSLPEKTCATLLALAKQFEAGGTEELENSYIFQVDGVKKAGGLDALKILGGAKEIIDETKRRLFAP